jgi:uncharacterized protein (TIGR03435 family)
VRFTAFGNNISTAPLVASESEIESLKGLNFETRIEAPQLMVQSLLADRFQLQSSIQTRELPFYVLVVANGGPKLKEVEPPPFPPPGTPPPPGAQVLNLARTGPNQFTATALPMHSIADWLTSFDEIGNRVLIDETGFEGKYDFVRNGVSMEPSQNPAVFDLHGSAGAIGAQAGLTERPS